MIENILLVIIAELNSFFSQIILPDDLILICIWITWMEAFNFDKITLFYRLTTRSTKAFLFYWSAWWPVLTMFLKSFEIRWIIWLSVVHFCRNSFLADRITVHFAIFVAIESSGWWGWVVNKWCHFWWRFTRNEPLSIQKTFVKTCLMVRWLFVESGGPLQLKDLLQRLQCSIHLDSPTKWLFSFLSIGIFLVYLH